MVLGPNLDVFREPHHVPLCSFPGFVTMSFLFPTSLFGHELTAECFMSAPTTGPCIHSSDFALSIRIIEAPCNVSANPHQRGSLPEGLANRPHGHPRKLTRDLSG